MKNIKGVTLVELIVGIVIIAVISVASLEFFQHCRRFIVDSEIRLGAVNFARETMELRAWDTEITDTTGWQNDRDLPAGAEFASGIRDNYGGSRLYRVEDGATGDYKVIKVKVGWDY